MLNGISAVVATYKRKDELARLFDSVIDNCMSDMELIIADQNTDGLLDELIERYQDRLNIQHVKLTEANQSKARNYGAALAKYNILCFPDDDSWFEKDTLHKVTEHFKTEADTDLLVINWKQNPLVHSTSHQLTKKEICSFRSVGYVTYVLFFKTQVFKKLGGFIEHIGIGQYIGGGEDSELTFRTLHNDHKIYFDASAKVNHKYISITTRDNKIIRARQRAMGLMYAVYDVPVPVIFKGIIAPFVKMLFAFNFKKSTQFYNIFLARIEGLIYGLKNKEKFNTGITNNVSQKSIASEV
ncbi:glycosyltransferase family 2 protein [soil metagenome]